MPAVIYIFPFFFIGMCVLVPYLVSKKGWADLVAKYRYDSEFSGTRVGLISASINSMNYQNSLVLKYNNSGIYLRPILLFRLFHKPIFIPWNEIKEERDKQILFFKFKELVIGNPFVAIIAMKRSTFEKLKADRF
jgi:hypothetical protein